MIQPMNTNTPITEKLKASLVTLQNLTARIVNLEARMIYADGQNFYADRNLLGELQKEKHKLLTYIVDLVKTLELGLLEAQAPKQEKLKLELEDKSDG